ncbi:hypothetical protein [Streptomyces phaeochromogenes]|uniref:hypothetical protein n=1 Tax=Streptomyces phaeochromogenes TaxID=1923 RepID=UPI0038670558|nr:hypothetical protein OG277_53035 [Streptomyces phaeochromogenes]
MDPRGGGCRTQARCFAAIAVPDGETLTRQQEELARAVLEVVLLAGLPPYNIEAAADREGHRSSCALPPPTVVQHTDTIQQSLTDVLWCSRIGASLITSRRLQRAL